MGVLKVLDGTDWRKVGCPARPHTYDFTGDSQFFTVPDGVTSLTVELSGAEGQIGDYRGAAVRGGRGGYLQVTLDVTPGETLRIEVGEHLTTQVGFYYSPYGGGGQTWISVNGAMGGKGGGATSIWRGSTLLAIAGGGGGAGGGEGGDPTEYIGRGGDGGALVGETGEDGQMGTTAGTGGTGSAGGTAGVNARTGVTDPTDGDYLQGGAGGLDNGWYPGGGGGGGYYGGGGGGAGYTDETFNDPPLYFGLTAAAGGGGGSSWTSGDVVTNTRGAREGHGQVFIATIPNPPGMLRMQLPDGSWVREACDTEAPIGNRLTNPGAELGHVDGFSDETSGSNLRAYTSHPRTGSYSFEQTLSDTDAEGHPNTLSEFRTFQDDIGGRFDVAPGELHAASGWGRPDGWTVDARVVFFFLNAFGGFVAQDVGSYVTLPADVFTQLSHTAIVPAGASKMYVRWETPAGDGFGGNVINWDDLVLAAPPVAHPLKIEDPANPGTWITVACMVPV